MNFINVISSIKSLTHNYIYIKFRRAKLIYGDRS